MIESKDIKKMVRHILRRERGIVDTNMMHPVREWFIGLTMSILIVCIGSWFSIYLYMFYNTEMNKEVVSIESAVPYNATVVKNALDLYAAKQTIVTAIIGVETAATSTESTEAETGVENIADPKPALQNPVDGGDQSPILSESELPTATLAP